MKTLNYYLSYIQNLRKSRFIKDVSIVAGGAATAQLINMAISPILTRLYGPDAFGILGVFNSVVAIFVPVASLSYAIAIVLPASDDDAKNLVKLSFLMTAGIFVISVFIILPFQQQIAKIFGFDVSSAYLMLVPLVVIMASGEQIFNQWLIRKKEFKSISGVAIARAAATGTLKSGIGYFYATAPVLLIINLFSHFLHIFLLWLCAAPTLIRSDYRVDAASHNKSEALKKVATDYRDFPIFRSPQNFINAMSQNLPTLILAALFGPVPAGFYSLTRRVLNLPSILISKSVGQVFLPRIAEAANRGEMLYLHIIKATGALALLGVFPFGIVIAFGPWLFSFVFGEEWMIAGEYARWLSVWLYFQFINVPSVKAIPLMGLQHQLLIYEITSTTVKIVLLFIGAYYLNDDIVAIAIFSIAGAIFYCGLIIWAVICSKTRLRQRFGKKINGIDEINDI